MHQLTICFFLVCIERPYGNSQRGTTVAPRNMLINDEGRIMLCDFGLTRRLRQGSDYYRQKNDVDMPMPWMAPEAFVGVGDKFNVKTDVRPHLCLPFWVTLM